LAISSELIPEPANTFPEPEKADTVKEGNMSELSKKVEYLKGLADGMNMSEDNQEQKLLLRILEVLEAVADEISELQDGQDEVNEYLENMDEDLAALEDIVFEDEDEDEDDDEEEEEEDKDQVEDEDADGDSIVEYECPHCGYKTRFDITDFDFEEDYLCPECQQPFFPEHEDDDEDEDEGGSEAKS
jgi:DNA-directed RNA polymerase subunit delta